MPGADPRRPGALTIIGPMHTAETATLLVGCRDRTGLVASLSDFIYRNGGKAPWISPGKSPMPAASPR